MMTYTLRDGTDGGCQYIIVWYRIICNELRGIYTVYDKGVGGEVSADTAGS